MQNGLTNVSGFSDRMRVFSEILGWSGGGCYSDPAPRRSVLGALWRPKVSKSVDFAF